jgi:TonB family protein
VPGVLRLDNNVKAVQIELSPPDRQLCVSRRPGTTIVTVRRTLYRVALALMAGLIGLAATVSAQDALARAKALYLSAAYDEALAILDQLRTESPRVAAAEVAQYRFFCLLALERGDEARKAIEDIVNADPLYRPSEAQTPPRIRSVFQETRKAILPSFVQRSYAEAKASFEKKDPQAFAQFDRLLAVLDDPDLKSMAQLSDLRTVVAGFRDLSKAIASAAASPPPAPARQSTPSAPIGTAQTGTSSGAGAAQNAASGEGRVPPSPPVVISQALPRWAPSKSIDARLGFKGAIEVMIDERGNVTSARLVQSVHPIYDEELLAAARKWRYKPAMQNGVPTSYVKIVEIQLQPVR